MLTSGSVLQTCAVCSYLSLGAMLTVPREWISYHTGAFLYCGALRGNFVASLKLCWEMACKPDGSSSSGLLSSSTTFSCSLVLKVHLAWRRAGTGTGTGSETTLLSFSWRTLQPVLSPVDESARADLPSELVASFFVFYLYSLLGDKKNSPSAATSKSHLTQRRRQVIRGKSSPILRKTPHKGLMQVNRHRLCCMPSSRTHLSTKEGMTRTKALGAG